MPRRHGLPLWASRPRGEYDHNVLMNNGRWMGDGRCNVSGWGFFSAPGGMKSMMRTTYG